VLVNEKTSILESCPRCWVGEVTLGPTALEHTCSKCKYVYSAVGRDAFDLEYLPVVVWLNVGKIRFLAALRRKDVFTDGTASWDGGLVTWERTKPGLLG